MIDASQPSRGARPEALSWHYILPRRINIALAGANRCSGRRPKRWSSSLFALASPSPPPMEAHPHRERLAVRAGW